MRFAAMGTWCHVIVHGGPADGCGRARDRIGDLERRWSRFLPDSEVSRLNAGERFAPSWETARLFDRAAEAAQLTDGRFDARVLAAMVRAGYGSAVLVAESSFDPGGIGKGLAADLVVGELLAAGAEGACVNLGGDLRAEGAPRPWVLDVEDPFEPEGPPLVRLGLNRGGVATSGTLKRGPHLIDPRTGEPAVTDAVAATVVAGTAWRAEAVATAAVVAGVDGGLALMESTGVTGLVIDRHGTVHHAAGLEPFLG